MNSCYNNPSRAPTIAGAFLCRAVPGAAAARDVREHRGVHRAVRPGSFLSAPCLLLRISSALCCMRSYAWGLKDVGAGELCMSCAACGTAAPPRPAALWPTRRWMQARGNRDKLVLVRSLCGTAKLGESRSERAGRWGPGRLYAAGACNAPGCAAFAARCLS